MKKINWKDVAARTVKTFVAAFLTALAVDVNLADVNSKMLSKVIFSAGSAGITAVWNVLLEIFRDPFNAWIDKIFGKIGRDDLTPVPGEDMEPDPDTLEEAEPGDLI